MDNKINKQEASTNKRLGSNFLYEVKNELSKTTWTPKKELYSLVKIVIITTFVFGFLLFFVDMSLKNVLQILKIGFRSLFG